MAVYRRILRKALLVFTWIGASLAIAMMLLVSFDVMVREVTGVGISGSVQMIELGMLALVFFGIAQTQHMGEHVSVEILVQRLTPNAQQATQLVMLCMYLLFCCALTYYTFTRALESMRSNEIMWMGVDVILQWPFRFVIPLGLTLLLLQLVDEIITTIMNMLKPAGEYREERTR